jgi:hypothetical protein
VACYGPCTEVPMMRRTRMPALWLFALSAIVPVVGCGGSGGESEATFETKMVYYAMPG